MRITPVSLDIQGLRSFRKQQTLKFSDEPGLGLVTGQNLVEPALGPNGSGKSSLWTAFFWCLYGKSERGLQSTGLFNRKGDAPLQVRFNFLLNGASGNYIERTWKPVMRIMLCLGGEERQVSQDELEQWLGMGPDVFTQAVMTSQFGKSFLDFSPAEKQKFLMQLMRVDRWDAYRDAADSLFAKLSPEILKGEAAIVGHEARLKSMTQEYETYMQRARDWSADRAKRILNLEDELASISAETEGVQSTRQAVVAAFIQEDVALLTEERLKLDGKVGELTQQISALNLTLGEANGRVKGQLSQLKKLDQLAVSGYLCPTCGQQADAAHIIAERTTLTEEIDATNSEVTRIAGEKTKLSTKSAQFSAQSISLHNRIIDVGRTKIAQEKRLKSFDTDLTSLDIKLKTVQAQLVAVGAETNQYEAIVRQRLEDIRAANEELDGFRTKLQAMKARQGINEFWKKAFKEIQLFLLAEVTTQLEMAYNTSLSALGMSQWRLLVSVENETKSGTTQNKFTVSVLSPDTAEPVPLESWCGGETQRLQLACAFGTFDLVRQLTQVTWDLEIWDEPGQQLSNEGMNDLFKILRDRAKVLGKQIFVTDHRTLQNEQFDFKRHVVKTESGSVIENS